MSEITDRLEIAELFARLSRLLDEARHDDAGTVYTDDVVVRSPRGLLRGVDEVTAHLRAHQLPGERTQHVHGDILVTVDGDHASASANQLVYFYRDGRPPHRESGVRLRYTAVRTPDGWRFDTAHIAVAFQRAA
ncbi:nuclear transport factor 2 family protein [Marinactinospora rubrisoli]|uniref:Nuclear transport factor 2 family protein n=1 Tax=Marinactinospora rubrisoli TaxID=2715399 RepID=A0ABW2KBL3_9ACTN